ncbi:MAG: hypothetical protein PHI06_08435, partial [Desulfobulbaceae bacterium]|nr:hypothetical protein [Desulfobulbaceae bacterium]
MEMFLWLKLTIGINFGKKVDLPGFYVITRRNAGPIQRGAMVNWESETIPNCRLIDISGTGIGFLKN